MDKPEYQNLVNWAILKPLQMNRYWLMNSNRVKKENKVYLEQSLTLKDNILHFIEINWSSLLVLIALDYFFKSYITISYIIGYFINYLIRSSKKQ